MRYPNPLGFLLWNYPPRNHKKIVVIDNTVYVGGLNFSDHNFSWHDMMVRFHSKKSKREFFPSRELNSFLWMGKIMRNYSGTFLPIFVKPNTRFLLKRLISLFLFFSIISRIGKERGSHRSFDTWGKSQILDRILHALETR